jgi:alkylation response protein AidB-like acyl-CoA dehydrogenase
VEFELDDDQRALLDAVETLLERRAGPARARELGADEPEYDAELDRALTEAGFLDLSRADDAGPLEAALVVEAVSRAAGVAAVGVRALVAPAVCDEVPDGPIALTRAGFEGPVRYATGARSLLIADGDGAGIVNLTPAMVEPVRSRYGYPMGRIHSIPTPRSLNGPSTRVLAWWRVALATELVGAMGAALDLTVDHVTNREQFGQPLGSFQAIQHGLAEATVAVQGARWLTLEAAWLGAPDEAAATAATHAAGAARALFPMLHQFTGAIGFTTEYDLHLWTMRLPALWQEVEWIGNPAAAVASARWNAEVHP